MLTFMINSGLNVPIPDIPIPDFAVPYAAPIAREVSRFPRYLHTCS